jgi:hypothetical protein
MQHDHAPALQTGKSPETTSQTPPLVSTLAPPGPPRLGANLTSPSLRWASLLTISRRFPTIDNENSGADGAKAGKQRAGSVSGSVSPSESLARPRSVQEQPLMDRPNGPLLTLSQR